MSLCTSGADQAPCEWLAVGGRVRPIPGCVESGGQLGTGPRPWGDDWATGGERGGEVAACCPSIFTFLWKSEFKTIGRGWEAEWFG